MDEGSRDGVEVKKKKKKNTKRGRNIQYVHYTAGEHDDMRG